MAASTPRCPLRALLLVLLACCRAGVDCAGGVALARVLTVNRTLTSLDLGHNSLGGGSLEWAHALSDALRANTTLLSLGLSGNRVGVRACCVLAEGVEGVAVLLLGLG